MCTTYIKSKNNLKIKKILNIQKQSKNIDLNSKFVIEGLKEIKKALDANYIIDEIFICDEIFKNDDLSGFFLKKIIIIKISLKIFKKIAYRKNSNGIIAIGNIKENKSLYKIKLNNFLILILDKIEKPGNFGAILRTAEAAGLKSIIISDPKFKIYNPNVIRSSIGAIFNIDIIVNTPEYIINWIEKKKINILALDINNADKNIYNKLNILNTCIVIGSESNGLSDIWLKYINKKIYIPMYGKTDSLNISNVAAIVIYEYIRQNFYNN